MNRVSLLLVAATALMAAGCSGGSSAEPDVTAPPPATSQGSEPVATGSSSTTSPTDPSPSTTVETVATEPSTSTSATSTPPYEPDDDRFLPEGLGTVVDSAPGVNSPGEITELIDNVWFFVPSETVDGDSNVVPPLPEDRDILAAYAEAQAAYHEQASMQPLSAEPSDRLAAAMVDGGQRLAENVLGPAASAGQHLDLTDGIVLRPVVIADPRSDSEAFIFDCQLDGTVFVNADGSLPDGQTRGVKQFPQIASVVYQDGEWIVERLTRDERACT